MNVQVGPEIEVVFFDLDDTLSDYASTRDRAIVTWTGRFAGWPLDDHQTRQRWLELEEYWFARYAAREVSHVQQRAGRIRDFLPWAADWDDERALAAFVDLLSVYESIWRPFPDARDALERALASGRRVGILTNGQHDYQSRKMRELGLADERLVMCASSTLPAGKPDIRAFQVACQRLRVHPDRAVMIGDNPQTDICGGQRAGLLTIQLRRHDEPVVGGLWVRSLDEICF